MSDSKGAAIEKILTKYARWATDLIELPRHQYPDATLDPAQAREAILALLAQEVNKARIDELEKLRGWGWGTDFGGLPNTITSRELKDLWERIEYRIKAIRKAGLV